MERNDVRISDAAADSWNEKFGLGYANPTYGSVLAPILADATERVPPQDKTGHFHRWRAMLRHGRGRDRYVRTLIGGVQLSDSSRLTTLLQIPSSPPG